MPQEVKPEPAVGSAGLCVPSVQCGVVPLLGLGLPLCEGGTPPSCEEEPARRPEQRPLGKGRLCRLHTVPLSVPRFEFLQPWHQYNAYYEFKKQFFLQKEGGDSAQVPARPRRGGEAGAFGWLCWLLSLAAAYHAAVLTLVRAVCAHGARRGRTAAVAVGGSVPGTACRRLPPLSLQRPTHAWAACLWGASLPALAPLRLPSPVHGHADTLTLLKLDSVVKAG